MSDKTETPRTDAAQKAYEDYCGRIADACREGKVSLSMAMDEFKKEVGPCPNDDWETARTMERELTQWREVLKDFGKEPDPEGILAELDYRDRQIEKWREVAGRLASVTTHQSECRFFIGESCDCGLDAAIAAYDATAKLSDGGNG